MTRVASGEMAVMRRENHCRGPVTAHQIGDVNEWAEPLGDEASGVEFTNGCNRGCGSDKLTSGFFS